MAQASPILPLLSLPTENEDQSSSHTFSNRIVRIIHFGFSNMILGFKF